MPRTNWSKARYIRNRQIRKPKPLAVAGARRLRDLLTSCHQLLLRFHLKITGIMALVQLTGEFTIDAIDHSPALDGWPLGRMVNRVNGELSSQLHERHDASDFEM